MRRQTTSSSIKNLLERYKTILRAPQSSVIKEVVRAYIAQGIMCDETIFAYSPTSRTVTLKVGGVQKTEMLLRKSAVLTELKKTLSDRDIPKDII